MTDGNETKASKKAHSKDAMSKETKRWIAAATGMGIGSAALVATLMYANRSKHAKTKPAEKTPRFVEPTD